MIAAVFANRNLQEIIASLMYVQMVTTKTCAKMVVKLMVLIRRIIVDVNANSTFWVIIAK